MKALWSDEHMDKEVKKTYEYITGVRNHLETESRLACKSLSAKPEGRVL